MGYRPIWVVITNDNTLHKEEVRFMRLFKRKILSVLCSIGLILGLLMINPMPVSATTADGGSLATAYPIQEGQSYTKTWEKYKNDYFYCTFNVSEKGYITLDFTKVQNASSQYRKLYIKLYDVDNNVVFYSRTNSSEDAYNYTRLNLGVEPGKYYLQIWPENTYSVPQTTTFSYDFTKSNNWEAEPNDAIEYAEWVNLGKNYTATFNGAEDGAEYDYYRFKVDDSTADYKIRLENYRDIKDASSTIYIYLRDPQGKTYSIKSKFVYEDNTKDAYYVLELPEQGDWYLYMYSYANQITQVSYNLSITKIEKPVTVSYRTHVQSYGWQDFVLDGAMSGTSGLGKRLEGIEIKVNSSKDIGIRYKTHVQSYGWQEWRYNGAMSGTSGEAKRLEAICIELTGDDKDKYDVYYRVHAQSYGWLGWAKNGQPAGTAGQSKRLEGIEIKLLPKGQLPGGTVGYSYIELGKKADNSSSAGMVNYMTHVQTYGNQSYVYDGSVSGTFGEAKRLEGIRIKLNTSKTGVSGGISYRTHVQTYGWLDWSKNGSFNGTSGEGKRLEAIEIKLTGEMANEYDVYYRVHAQTFGWLGWACNGQPAGTAGYSKRLEGIQIVLLPKGSAAPSVLPGVAGTSSFIQK
ncbi:MAG: hypothetical protein E7257_08085 [Lachnospiraceae bacterium]|nr:hypothetical protein [Lachnospiraceae bacterium]